MTMDTTAADAMFALHGDFDITNITIARTDIAAQRANRQRRLKAMQTEAECKEARQQRSIKADHADKPKEEARLDRLRVTRTSLDTKDELARAIQQVMAKRAEAKKVAADPAKPRHSCSDLNDAKAKPLARLRTGSDPNENKAEPLNLRRVTRWPRGEMDEWEQARDLDMQQKMPSLRRAAERVVATWWDADGDDSACTSEDERKPFARKPIDPREERRMAWQEKQEKQLVENPESKNKELERPELIRKLHEKKVRIAVATWGKDIAVSDSLHRSVFNSWRPIERELDDDVDVRSVKFSECGRCAFVQKFHHCEVFCSATGRLVTKLCRREEVEMLSALVSPDGRQVATVEQTLHGGEVNLWDVERRHDKSFHLRAEHGLLWACYSPDGNQLATGSYMGVVTLWSTETGKRLQEVEEMEHDDEVVGARFSKDGLHLITVISGGTALLWDLATGHRMHTVWTAQCGFSEFMEPVRFSPDGAYVMRRRPSDGRIVVSCGITGKFLYQVKTIMGNVREARFSPDSQHIMIVTSSVEVRAAATGEMVIDHGEAWIAAFLPLTPAPWWPQPAADA